MSFDDDMDDLRDFGEYEEESFDEGEMDALFDDGTAAASEGMSGVEQIILAVFVLLNLVALVVIILLITGVLNP